MLPGFTADALLETRAYDAIESAPRWSAGRGVSPRAGVYTQELRARSAEGSSEVTPTAACLCPCCITHACGFLDLSTCLTCC
jgi:hypothetical protein